MTYIMMSAEELILAADALDLLDAETGAPVTGNDWFDDEYEEPEEDPDQP